MKVLVVDDNAFVRAGLAAVLTDVPGVTEVVEAGDGVEAQERLADDTVDVMLLDVRMPRKDGLTVLRELGSADDAPAVIMMTHSDDQDIIREALALGARGYLVHGSAQAEELASALATCQRGGLVLGPEAAETVIAAPPPEAVVETVTTQERPDLGLTEREAELMDELALGLSNSDIAGKLFLSEKTVKNHLNRIYAKLAVANRGAAIALWLGR